ncbi:hypothetical protein APICC_08751 [Apis cerana cerana]|uniref:Uncharacterized protein n=1 Tax=Apis cerana cerana TaxID=94128 RepID=A0A2A3E2P2_APICC|nr:hypothetical protein APICC_08751 [Apis cerana cerana]
MTCYIQSRRAVGAIVIRIVAIIDIISYSRNDCYNNIYTITYYCLEYLCNTARSKSLSQIKEQLLNEELICETEKSRRSQSESKMHIPETNENR